MKINNKLFFLKEPKESGLEGIRSGDRVYFVKNTRRCRNTHEYLYDKYDIREVTNPKSADIIVSEWPSFKKINNIDCEIYFNITLSDNEELWVIDATTSYLKEVEKIWCEYIDLVKISVNTFLSTFFSEKIIPDMEYIDKIIDLSVSNSHIACSKLLDIDIKYSTIIGYLLSKIELYCVPRIFYLSKHNNMDRISSSVLLNKYLNGEIPDHEKDIVKQIVHSKSFFRDHFPGISDVKYINEITEEKINDWCV